ncbi:lipase family protein [Bacillus cereus group sp. Bce041]|uniref:lipase family protein n=1 Tax=Bacillus cereus group TaxID=86661 RepID=UPI000470B708|nr:lipase [Bacillus cereus]
MTKGVEKTENYRLTSDWGKLKLAGEDIYSFNNSEEPYNKTGENGRELNINTLEEKFGATLIEVEVDKDTGFAAYAFKDNKTGEVVISYVGTEAGKDNNSDVVVDAEIGGHNLTNANKLVFNDWEHELEVKQYDQGEAFYEKVKQYADGKTISITGHSLGGGIANTVALRHQEDDIDVLALNPAPVLNRDVDKFGNGFDMKNVRNIINQNDPLHIGIKAADFTLPGRMYKIPNQAGHSYAFTVKDYDENGHLIWIDKLASDNDTGWDIIPGILELSQSTGAIYTGTINDVFHRKVSIQEEKIAGNAINLILSVTPISTILGGILWYSDVMQGSKELEKLKDIVQEGFSRLNTKYEGLKSQITAEAIQFSLMATVEIKGAVDIAVEWIETTLAKCKEKVLEVLESVFNTAINFLAGSVVVYLATSEILDIAKEVAASYVQDLLDLFKGDFVVDTNVATIVSEHILSHRHSLLNLFMNDNSRGINRSLLGEIAKDVKELSKDLKQLNDDVSEAVFSMFAKDEELGAVSYY